MHVIHANTTLTPWQKGLLSTSVGGTHAGSVSCFSDMFYSSGISKSTAVFSLHQNCELLSISPLLKSQTESKSAELNACEAEKIKKMNAERILTCAKVNQKVDLLLCSTCQREEKVAKESLESIERLGAITHVMQ